MSKLGGALEKSHKTLEKELISAAQSAINSLSNGNNIKFKTVSVDKIIGHVFGAKDIYASIKKKLDVLLVDIDGTEIKWNKAGTKFQIKFSNPKAYLESVGVATDDQKLAQLKSELAFCSSPDAVLFRESLQEKHCNTDNKRNDVILTAKFLDYVSSENYEITNRRVVSTAIYTQKDGSKILERRSGTIKKTIRDVLGFNDDRIDFLFTFDPYEDPLSVYANVNMKLDAMTIDGVVKPYLSLLSSHIDHVQISCRALVTIENKATFHLWAEQETLRGRSDVCVVFCAGFSGSDVLELLKRVIEKNDIKVIYHFGDIDNGGFNILHDIENKTGVKTVPIIWTPELIEKHGAVFDYGNRKPKNDVEAYAIERGLRVEQEKIGGKALGRLIDELGL